MEHCPVELVFGRIVGAVVAAPPGDALEVTTFVEVALVEFDAGVGGSSEEFALQKSPVRGRHRGIDCDGQGILQ